jgi:hypothetical protein
LRGLGYLPLALALRQSLPLLKTTPLYPFKELTACSKGLLKCGLCSLVLANKASMTTHLNPDHRGKLEEADSPDLASGYTVVAQGQSLEKNKYFFQVESRNKDKGKGLQAIEEEEDDDDDEREEEALEREASPNKEARGGEEVDLSKQGFLRKYNS